MTPNEIASMAGMGNAAHRDEIVWGQLDRKADKYHPKTGQITEEGQPHRHVPNAITVFRFDPRMRERLRYNEFSATVEIDGAAISDEAETGLMLWLHKVYGLTLETKKVGEAVRKVARERTYHPVREYLEALKWDGQERVDSLLCYYLGADDTDLNAEMSRRWAISAVARVMEPGCKVDTVLILAGPQGAQKSTAFRELAVHPEWFCDTPIDIRNKDAYQAIAGIWLYEMAELASMKPRDAETVKAFIAAQVDRYRPPYGRNPVAQPRQCVFVGTTNEAEFLRDSTGARRFWPARVCQEGRYIDIAAIQRDRDQLWAEALTLYRGRERWWLDLNASAMLEDEQEQWRQEHPWEDDIKRWLKGQPVASGVTITDVLEKACSIDTDKKHAGNAKTVGSILTGLGWEKRRKRTASGREYRWFPPGSSPS